MRTIWTDFWNDETGALISAELATVATVGVLATTVGLTAASQAVNEELLDVARAFRSLNQSYGIAGFSACGAWRGASRYVQVSADESIRDMCGHGMVAPRVNGAPALAPTGPGSAHCAPTTTYPSTAPVAPMPTPAEKKLDLPPG